MGKYVIKIGSKMYKHVPFTHVYICNYDSFLTGKLIKKWFKNHRSEFGRLKAEMRHKNAPIPLHWTVKKRWRWENFMF